MADGVMDTVRVKIHEAQDAEDALLDSLGDPDADDKPAMRRLIRRIMQCLEAIGSDISAGNAESRSLRADIAALRDAVAHNDKRITAVCERNAGNPWIVALRYIKWPISVPVTVAILCATFKPELIAWGVKIVALFKGAP